MKNICYIEFRNGSKEEVLPNFSPDFPYIASYVEFDKYIKYFVPWHWHKEMELFYIKNGTVEYHTPKGKVLFPTGSGGLVNSNVLHMTKPQIKNTIQLVHLFDSSLIGGQQGSRIEQKYITPLISAPQIELLGFYPHISEHVCLLENIQKSFALKTEDYAYEIQLRSILSEIWCQLFALSSPFLKEKGVYDKSNDKLKMMMIYIHENFAEKISVSEIANSAFISERECFRTFREHLHITPIEYLRNYRLQKACHMLTQSQESIAFISNACALGTSSYFGKIFRENIGCTPLEYRQKWQNNDINRQI